MSQATLVLALLAATAAPRLPGPAPQPGRARIERNAACVGCHPDVAAEWAASLHRASAVDPEYRRAHDREPQRFCRDCHVPEHMPQKTDIAAAEAVGVGCVTCHWAGPDAVLAAPGPVAPAASAAHRVVVAPEFGAAGACAACHDFPFPDAALRETPAFMQSTAQEHRASWAGAYACADCHMPDVADPRGGHRSHRFAGSRDPGLVALAVGVTATRTGPDAVEVTLTPGAAGHAFPTGDLFRRLEVRVQPLHTGAPAQLRHLGRRFADGQERPGIVVRREVEDSRLHADPVVLRFALDGAGDGLCEDPATQWVAYRVSYQRVAFPRPRARGGAELEGEVVIAEGVLPAWDADA